MAKKKLTQSQLAKLRADYLAKRQELLQSEVDRISVILFDQVYTEYLSALEQEDGKIVYNGKNINAVKGLDKIYKNFRDKHNAPVIKQFVLDMQGITPLNQEYFASIQNKPTKAIAEKALKAVNSGLGLNEKLVPRKGGYIDKVLRDDSVLKAIKKKTTEAITNRRGFQQFRNEIRETIVGVKDQPLSGKVQQYYRNAVYDSYARVDRLNSETFADELGMQYFFWAGGIIPTSRPLCIHLNGKIVNSASFQHLKYSQLKKKYQPGLPKDWKPLIDMGGFSCIHRKDYVATEVALAMREKWLDESSLLK